MSRETLIQLMSDYSRQLVNAQGTNLRLNNDEQGALFADELIAVEQTAYKYEMPAPVALTLFPQIPNISPGAQFTSYRMYTAQGMAKVMASFGSDMPMMNIKGKKYFAKMFTFGLGYGFTYDEMLSAATANTPLDSMLGVDCREMHERTISNVIWKGDTEHDIVGFSVHPNIAVIALKGGWETASDEDIIADNVAMISSVNKTSIYNVNQLHYPSEAWTAIQGKKISGTSDTVLSFLRKAYPEITFRKNPDCDEDGTVMAFDMSARHFSQATPILFRQLPPQYTGLDISKPALSKTAGAIVRAPLAAAASTKVVG
ncbi:DUF2184 domain-containing protein [Salmonella enterica]|nr:DUF2184 domain-containing protein [Salmonella enterica]EGH5309462.1 DUF2184 domain-containing protein [Salmonella enterica]EGW8385419.1 DUF2184 domain-containing protein [Salmonella enterica]EHL2428965.1 DUF2184 domain-containing protein [Salmonella enterica]EHO4316894.1 DUF2184 domain-containing protein [Salmonella enterica]